MLVTKREMVDLFRDLDKEHPELKEQLYDRGKREPTLVVRLRLGI